MRIKFFTTIIFSLLVVFVFAETAFATQHTGAQPKGYELLAPIPGSGIPTVAPLGQGGLAKYLQSLFNLGLGIIIALAVVMIVIGGAQYLSTDAVSGKEFGKDKLWHAVQGLIIALGAFLILNTINPDILKLNLDLGYLKQPEKVKVLGVFKAPTTIENARIGFMVRTENGIRAKLRAGGITFNHLPCETYGQTNCTSVGGLPDSAVENLIKLKGACGCKLDITGGTEWWLHSKNTAH
ncbi:MAG: pilin, partial [Patescibacteria group bacterium]